MTLLLLFSRLTFLAMLNVELTVYLPASCSFAELCKYGTPGLAMPKVWLRFAFLSGSATNDLCPREGVSEAA